MRLNTIPASFDGENIAVKNWTATVDADREARVIANAIVDFTARPKLPLEAFPTGKHRGAWRRLQAATAEELIPQDLRDAYEYLADPTQAKSDEAYLAAQFVARNGISVGAKLLNFLRDSSSPDGAIIDRLLACEIDILNPPPPDLPVYYVNGILTGTTGNIGAIAGRAKTFKSSVLEAHASAAIKAHGLGNPNADTLGITSSPPGGKALVVIDTEQSKGDSCALAGRTLRRLGLTPEERPDWFRVFSLAGLQAKDLTAGLPSLLDKLAADHGGIHAVHIDGGADFAANINDPAEAQSLCAIWHGLAIKHRCHLLTVIHSNEGKESDDVARGWLGKQLRRKSESNLQVKRTENLVTLWGDTGQRRAPIPEHAGSTFRWDNEQRMAVSAKPNIPPELVEIGEAVFRENGQQGFSELKRTIAKVTKKSEETAKRRIKEMSDCGLILKNGEFYRLAQPL